jgi:hypothetical protein
MEIETSSEDIFFHNNYNITVFSLIYGDHLLIKYIMTYAQIEL